MARTENEGIPTGASRPIVNSVPSQGRVSVVIPTLNEASNIGWVLDRMPECVDEVLLVDGRSTDDTVARARAARHDVRIVRELRPGKGWALRSGFEAAKGHFIVMLDGDGSMDPQEISRFVDALESGYDFVKGSRYLPEAGSLDITWLRDLGNRFLLGITNLSYGSRFTDLCYGFCAFRKYHLDGFALNAEGFEVEAQLVTSALRLKLRIAEVPSLEGPRRYGISNLRAVPDGTRILLTLLKGRFRRLGPAVPAFPAPSPVALLRTDGKVVNIVDLREAEQLAVLDLTEAQDPRTAVMD